MATRIEVRVPRSTSFNAISACYSHGVYRLDTDARSHPSRSTGTLQIQSETASSLLRRKFFYVFTCEYCLSHYVTAAILAITRFKLVYADWRGYVISLFSLVWIANQYMSIYDRLRLDIKHEHIAISADQKQMETIAEERPQKAA